MSQETMAALRGAQGVADLTTANGRDAFARLVEEHGPDVHRLCLLITTDRTLAEDAAQRAWQRAWQKVGSLRDPEKFRPWLLRVAANEAKQVLRKVRFGDVTLVAVEEIGDSADDPQRYAALRDALRRLDPRDRELLAYRYVLGFSSDELAPMLGVSAGGVRTRLKRIRDRLYSELRP